MSRRQEPESGKEGGRQGPQGLREPFAQQQLEVDTLDAPGSPAAIQSGTEKVAPATVGLQSPTTGVSLLGPSQVNHGWADPTLRGSTPATLPERLSLPQTGGFRSKLLNRDLSGSVGVCPDFVTVSQPWSGSYVWAGARTRSIC